MSNYIHIYFDKILVLVRSRQKMNFLHKYNFISSLFWNLLLMNSPTVHYSGDTWNVRAVGLRN